MTHRGESSLGFFGITVSNLVRISSAALIVLTCLWLTVLDRVFAHNGAFRLEVGF